jgi:hypothetical protein
LRQEAIARGIDPDKAELFYDIIRAGKTDAEKGAIAAQLSGPHHACDYRL